MLRLISNGNWLPLTAATLALNACSLLEDPYATTKSVVGNQLKDPNSAQFSDMNRKGDAVCGYVNSKNGFGAYSGREAFVVKSDNVSFDDASIEFNTLVTQNCDSSFATGWMVEDANRSVKEMRVLTDTLKDMTGH